MVQRVRLIIRERELGDDMRAVFGFAQRNVGYCVHHQETKQLSLMCTIERERKREKERIQVRIKL